MPLVDSQNNHVLASPPAVQPDLTLKFVDWSAPDLEHASRIWLMLESIVEVLKIAPDQDFRLAARVIIHEIQFDGMPRLLRLVELAALHGRCAAKPIPN
jgi:hypothetical protein